MPQGGFSIPNSINQSIKNLKDNKLNITSINYKQAKKLLISSPEIFKWNEKFKQYLESKITNILEQLNQNLNFIMYQSGETIIRLPRNAKLVILRWIKYSTSVIL